MVSSDILKLFFPVYLILLWTDFILAASREYAITDAKTEHLTYEWTIKNFHRFPQKPGEYITSSVFRTEDNQIDWILRLYPHGPDAKTPDTVAVFLELLSPKAAELKMRVRGVLSILESKNVVVSRKIDSVYDKATMIGQGYPDFVLRSTLLNLPRSDHKFKIRVEIDMPMRIITKLFEPLEEKMLGDLEKHRLNEDFGRLFGQEKFSDAKLRIGDERFPVHKVVLATRSPVFARLVEGNDDEANGVVVGVMEPAVIKAILEFIYTDDVADLEPLAYILLAAAEKFELPRLKTMTERVLYKSLDEDNAADILVITDRNHSYKLKAHVMEYIVDHLSAVKKSAGYKDLEERFPKLLTEVEDLVSHGNSNTGSC